MRHLRKTKKIITGWNALALEGFVELYRATYDKEYLQYANELAEYLVEHHTSEDQASVSRTADPQSGGFSWGLCNGCWEFDQNCTK